MIKKEIKKKAKKKHGKNCIKDEHACLVWDQTKWPLV
jgi:hypothetical protein